MDWREKMKKYLMFPAVLITLSFMLIACSEDKKVNNHSNISETTVNNGKESKVDNNQESLNNTTKENQDSQDNKINDASNNNPVVSKEKITDGKISKIVNRNYEEIVRVMVKSELAISELLNESSEKINVVKFMESGVDTSHPFYGEMYSLLYPRMKKVVSKQGMGTIIDNAFLLFMNTRNTTPFSPSFDKLEVLEKDNAYFKIKQSTQLTAHSNDRAEEKWVEYIIEFIRENGQWKFLGAQKVNRK